MTSLPTGVPNVMPHPCNQAMTDRNWDAVRQMILNIVNGVNPAPGFLIDITPSAGTAIISVKCSNALPDFPLLNGYVATWDAAAESLLFVEPGGGGDPEPDETGCQYPFLNTTGETIPPYAVMGVTGVNTALIKEVTVEKPSATLRRQYAINSDAHVDNGDSGFCSLNDCIPWALYDPTGITGYPDVDTQLGPKPGSWLLHLGYPGYRAIGSSIPSGSDSATLVFYEGIHTFFGVTTSTITAASGSTPGSTLGTGTVALYTEVAGVIQTSVYTINVVNTTTSTISSGKLVQGKRINGKWKVDVEDCG